MAAGSVCEPSPRGLVALVAGLVLAGLGAPPAHSSPNPLRFDDADYRWVGSNPDSVAIGDVTGDGRNDVVLSTSYYFDPQNDYKLFLFRQLPDGTLGSAQRFDSHPYGGRGLAVGDLNRDGAADVALATEAGVDLYYGVAGSLQGPALIPGTGPARDVEIADTNRDRRNDVVVGTPNAALLARNTGSGLAISRISRQASDEIEVGDVTGDGRLDVVGFAGRYVHVFPQMRVGGFSAAAYYEGAGGYGEGIAVADLTGDGLDDVALTIGANWPSAQIRVFPQSERGGRLEGRIVYRAWDIPEPAEALDMSGDGLPDLVAVHGSWIQVGVFIQGSDGSLLTEDLYEIPDGGYGPKAIALGDFSGDGLPDIALASFPYVSGLVFLRQLPRLPPPAPPPPPPGTLYDQYDRQSVDAEEIISQDFLPDGDRYDSEGADDFIVPGGSTWTATGVDADGYDGIFGAAESFNVRFYAHEANLPGALVAARLGQAFTDVNGDVQIAVGPGVGLLPGHYWLSVQAVESFRSTAWYWQHRALQAYAPAAWRNPQQGYTARCPGWGERQNCVRSRPSDADQVWRLRGTSAVGPPPPGPPPPPLPPPPPPPPAPRGVCRVPNVVGKKIGGARVAIRKARCSLGRVRRSRSRRARGRVVRQSPRAGTRQRAGGRVNLVVSRGRS
ncbi:MAG TPA: FG-GAP-like repeat-containing protein [Gaiellaceae bacterium]|nr:FG-GAP-like repeat-containing protein [Gaiellaceae bacterium]